MADYLTPEEVDEQLKLRRGKAARLARRGKLPAIILPDGTIRFDSQELDTFLKAKSAEERQGGDDGRR